jgi:hypothetical protein
MANSEINHLQADVERLEKALIWLVSVLEDSEVLTSSEAEDLGKILIDDEEI